MLEFKEGVNSRPVLRSGTREEQRVVSNGGTRVSVKISEKLEGRIRSGEIFGISEKIEDSIAWLCPCMDCNICVDTKNNAIVHANDWLTIKPIDLIKRVVRPNNFNNWNKHRDNDIELLSQNMEFIMDGRTILGRACLLPYWNYGVSVIGGQRGDSIHFFGGVLIGNSINASRDKVSINLKQDAIKNWAKSQRDKSVYLDESLQLQLSKSLSLFLQHIFLLSE